MSKKVSAFIGMLLTVVMTVTFTVSTFHAGAASDASYDMYLADFLLTDETAQSFINRDYQLPYRKYVEDRRNSLTYMAMLETWEVLTFDGKLADKTGKSVAYYETILYDTIYGGLDGTSELNDLTSKVESAKASTMKTLLEYSEELIDCELKDVKKDSDLYNTLIAELDTCSALKAAFEGIDNLKGLLDKCTDLYEAVEKVSKVEALVENQEQIQKIVTDIGNSTLNPALKLACERMTVIMEDEIPDEIIAGVFASEGTIGDAVDEGFKAVWDVVLADVAGAEMTFAVKAGQVSGKLASGMLFSTDKDVEHVYAMDALYDIEDITIGLVKKYQSQYESSPSPENARLYTEAFRQLIKTYIEGVDYSKKYAEITNEMGLINQLFQRFESEDYKKFIQILDDMRFSYEDYLHFIDVCVYNNYLANVPNEMVREKVKMVKKTTNVTDADIAGYFDTYATVDRLYTNRVIKKKLTLTEDYMTYGNLTIEANVNLNGYTLTIHGNLVQNGGQMIIVGGTLNVDGDYTIQNKTHIDPKTKETVQDSNGTLCMQTAAGTVNIHGDFCMKSNDGYAYNKNYFRDGTILIGGNFYQYNNRSDSSKQNFKAVGTVVKFVGSGTHEIYFESESSYIGNHLEVPEDAKIKFTGAFHGFKLAQDIVIEGDTVYDCDTMSLNGYTLTINGNLVQNGGQMIIEGGTLNVNGDYTIQNKTHIDPKTKETVQDSNGILNMQTAAGTVNIHGDFCMKSNDGYTYNKNYFRDGTILIDGNFYQYNNISNNSKENFQAVGTGVKFVGSGTHEIYFESESSYIGNHLEVPEDAKIKFTGAFHGFKLAQDIVIEGDTVYDCDTMSLNGYTLTINGNLVQNGGEMKIGGGTLNVNGDYTIQNKTHIDPKTKETVQDSNGILYMQTAAGTVNIHGDFCMKSNDGCAYNKNYFSDGTILIDGNFYQYNNISNNSKENFLAVGTVVKFVGKGLHTITSESAETKIPDIALTDGAALAFNGNFGGFSPVDSCTFSSSETTVAKVTSNTVQAIGSGTAKLTIEEDSKSTTINLTVNALITGDANGDGEVTAADVVLLQKWLLAVPHVRLSNWEACDLNDDEVINIFDLCLLKRKLLS